MAGGGEEGEKRGKGPEKGYLTGIKKRRQQPPILRLPDSPSSDDYIISPGRRSVPRETIMQMVCMPVLRRPESRVVFRPDVLLLYLSLSVLRPWKH